MNYCTVIESCNWPTVPEVERMCPCFRMASTHAPVREVGQVTAANSRSRPTVKMALTMIKVGTVIILITCTVLGLDNDQGRYVKI